MPDLSNLLSPSPPPPLISGQPPCLLPARRDCAAAGEPEIVPEGGLDGASFHWGLGFPIPSPKASEEARRGRKGGAGKLACAKPLSEHVRDWVAKKKASGVPERECALDFFTNAPMKVECRICGRCIHTGEGVVCSVSECPEIYHRKCAEKELKSSISMNFKCPKHACYICGQKLHFRCVRCLMASHSKCAPWPYHLTHIPVLPPPHLKTSNNKSLKNQPTLAHGAVCWKHSPDWRMEIKPGDLTSNIEEAFSRLPLPYTCEEFSIGVISKDITKSQSEPSSYVHIRRNIYLFKKKRENVVDGVGCRNCNADSICRDGCECRSLLISCSKACHCSNMCQNRPFRREKMIKVVKTEYCGWGVVARQSIRKGDFVIEYIGEVINDALCEQRLWDMKRRGDHNFYMCEIRKDFTIDATFKGNASRFLNHSCSPNCNLEKWQVDGETRVGVFASRTIKVGEPLTYDYRFVHFGPMVKCFCGAPNCQGSLGSKRKVFLPTAASTAAASTASSVVASTETSLAAWGCKRKRSRAAANLTSTVKDRNPIHFEGIFQKI